MIDEISSRERDCRDAGHSLRRFDFESKIKRLMGEESRGWFAVGN
jgi:hypothetical protein